MEAERSLFLSLAFMATLVAPAGAQLSTEEELAEPTPLPALNSVWIEELNWMEVRDAVAAGKTTAIIPTGGIEQNGRYVALGKHNYILEVACEDIARKLGNALCAPIIKLVPEGDIDPPSSHMRYPGTISLREETFEAVFIGDSGRNQDGQEAVAEALNARWSHARAHHIAEYYDNDGTIAHMEETFGIVEVDDGYHDSYWITTLMMVNDPSVVRYDERVKAGLTDTNGVDISPAEKSIEIGQELMRWRVDQTVGAIRRSIEGS
jgi:creatinine amidohydrolase/Fe(II)-dependent formamide hydrolase-like protein